MRYFKLFCSVGLIAGILLVASEVENYMALNNAVVREVATSKKVVALTFDDGPVQNTTSEVLKVLKEKNVKATFFVVGEMAERYPSLVLQEANNGHEIGNHSYDHARLTQLSEEKVDSEFIQSERAIAGVAASQPKLFRPPEGKYNRNILKLAHDKGYAIILWSVDPADWKYPPAQEVVNTVVSHVRPGSIILLHDGRRHSSTPAALAQIIDELKNRGYEFVKVSELLQYR